MKNLITLIFLLVGTQVFAQKESEKIFIEAADSLSKVMKMAALEENFDKKQELVEQFSLEFIEILKKPYAFDFSFDSIPGLGSLVSKDKKVRVLTWAVPVNTKKQYTYYGAIMRKRMNINNPIADVFLLEDTKDEVSIPEKEVLTYPNWFGCVYYEIVDKKDGANTIYTLLGFDFNDGSSKKRYIDILTFTNEGFPKFGLPIFVEEDKQIYSRIILEYSIYSTIYLSYIEEKDKIIFNYLHPITPEKENDKRFYVPDVTFDGFEFKKGKWLKLKEVEMIKKN